MAPKGGFVDLTFTGSLDETSRPLVYVRFLLHANLVALPTNWFHLPPIGLPFP